MSERDLQRRVDELEQEVARLRQSGPRGKRWRSAFEVWGLPLVSVAIGPDPERGEWRGHARGVFALGDVATGVFAVGGLARGVVALGGLSLGLVSFGGMAIGLLLAIGGGAVGGLALGGAAAGGVAVGGAAAGRYACGGGAYGTAVISPTRSDPEALEFFRDQGLEGLCRPRPR